MCDCEHHHQDNGGFIFGLFIGAIIAAFVAIYIYKNNKSSVLADLKSKLEKYFKDFTKTAKTAPKTKKISVTLPKKVESLDITPAKVEKPHNFVKPKK